MTAEDALPAAPRARGAPFPLPLRMAARLAVLFALAAMTAACEKKREETIFVPEPIVTIEQVNREIAARLNEQKAALDNATRGSRDASERKRLALLVQDAIERYKAAQTKVNNVTREQLTMLLPAIRAPRAELAGAETNNCTVKARDQAVTAMDLSLRALDEFSKTSGAPSAEVMRKLNESRDGLADAERELGSCF